MTHVGFIIIGAQKSGTTSLAYQLAQHPQICFASIKEPHFFSRPRPPIATLAEYHALFSPGSGQVCGEASTSYTFFPEFPETAQKIQAYNADMKLIYIMRHPVDRMASLYAHRRHRGLTRFSFSADREVVEETIYVNRSRYAIQLKPYFEAFPSEAVKLLIFEEYIANPLETLQALVTFLQLRAFDPAALDVAPKNQSISRPSDWRHERVWPVLLGRIPKHWRRRLGIALPGSPELSPEVRRALWTLVEADVQAIEALLGRRLDCWRGRR